MARTKLTVHKINKASTFSETFTTLMQAVDAADGAEYTPTARDGKHMLLVHNKASAAKTVTVLAESMIAASLGAKTPPVN